MDWKLIAIGLALLGVAITVAVLFKRRGGLQGFRSGGGAATAGVPSFTMYYADWCPHCQSAKPEFEKLVANGDVTVGSKRCQIRMVGQEENPEEMKAKGIKGFPTFMLESADGQQYEYKGARSTDGYLAFINEKLGGGI